MTYISARPTGLPNISHPEAHQPFSNCRFFPRGRDALAFGLSAKIAQQGKVLVPAFFCAKSLDEITLSGIKVEWMDVCDDLGWEPVQLASRLASDDVAAVVLCDFFGWVHPRLEAVIELAKERNVLAIRDCCHSPLSWRVEHAPADLTIFSFRKLIPIWDGGVLIGRDSLPHWVGSPSPIGNDILRGAVRRFERFLTLLGIVNPYPLIDLLRRSKPTSSESVPHFHGEVRPSRTFLRYLDSASALNEISNTRRGNFLILKSELSVLGLYPLIPSLGNHDVPQIFPLVCSDAFSLVKFLRHRGVGATCWPGDDLPYEVKQSPFDFPMTTKMKREIACLPLHQDITRRDLVKMVAFVSEWLEKTARN